MVIETVTALAGGALMGSRSKETVQRVFQAFRERSPIARDVGHEFDRRVDLRQTASGPGAEVGGLLGLRYRLLRLSPGLDQPEHRGPS